MSLRWYTAHRYLRGMYGLFRENCFNRRNCRVRGIIDGLGCSAGGIVTFYATVISSSTAINVSDSGSGSDTVAVTASVPVTDSGSGSDAVSALQANVPVSDAGLGSDVLSSLQAQIPVSDSGLGSDRC